MPCRKGECQKKKASVFFGVPRTTLIDKINGRYRPGSKIGRDPYLSKEEEDKIVKWIVRMGKSGVPVRKSDVQSSVQKLLQDNPERQTPFKDCRPGKGWMAAFLRRHPQIRLRKPERVSKARAAATEPVIRQWFKGLKLNLEELGALDVLEDGRRIFNSDETCIRLCPSSGKVLGESVWRNVYEIAPGAEKSNLTFLGTFSANGEVVAPMIIYPYKRLPAAIGMEVPDDFYIGYSDSGWMKSETFYEFVSKAFNPWLEENEVPKPVLLLVDGHRTHVTVQVSKLCQDFGIILYLLPPNTTHMLQPADVGAFKPLKHYWREAVGDYQRRDVNAAVTRREVAPLLKVAIEKVPRSAIVNAFRACGLFPYNPDAVDYSKCIVPIEETESDCDEVEPVDLKKTLQGLEYLLGPNTVQAIAEGRQTMSSNELAELFRKLRSSSYETERYMCVFFLKAQKN